MGALDWNFRSWVHPMYADFRALMNELLLNEADAWTAHWHAVYGNKPAYDSFMQQHGITNQRLIDDGYLTAQLGAPAQIPLAPALLRAMDAAWQRSGHGTPQEVEHGGSIIQPRKEGQDMLQPLLAYQTARCFRTIPWPRQGKLVLAHSIPTNTTIRACWAPHSRRMTLMPAHPDAMALSVEFMRAPTFIFSALTILMLPRLHFPRCCKHGKMAMMLACVLERRLKRLHCQPLQPL